MAKRPLTFARGSSLAIATIVAGCLVAGVSSATAADLASRVRPNFGAVTPTFSWTGFYGGLLVGQNWTRQVATEYYTANGDPTGQVYKYAPQGVSGGLKLGANQQFGMLVAGVEADLEAGSIHGGFVDPQNIGKGKTDVIWQGSARARLGLAYEHLLFYGTGGITAAKFNTAYTFTWYPPEVTENFSQVRMGWTLGGGVDYALTDNWILGLDYRHSEYDKVKNVSNSAFPGLTGKHVPKFDTLHLSAAYKF